MRDHVIITLFKACAAILAVWAVLCMIQWLSEGLMHAGTSRPQSRALTPAGPQIAPASNQLCKSQATKSGVYAYGQSPSAGSAQGQRWSPGASSQVLKLDQQQDRQPAGATAANRAHSLSPLKGR